MQQVSAMSALVTLGDVALSPAAWRLVRDACDGDAPPSLRGAWRLNRIKVHEIVPPLSHHPLNRAVMTRLIPSSPDPVATIAALAPLVPHALRRQLMELGPASAAWLQARRQRREHSGGESGESGEESGAESDASESLADDDLARSSAGGAAVNPGSARRAQPGLRRKRPGVKPKTRDVATVVAHVPGPNATRGGFCVSVPDAATWGRMVTTATSAVAALCNRFGRTAELVRCARSGYTCLLYTSPSPRDATLSRMPSSA